MYFSAVQCARYNYCGKSIVVITIMYIPTPINDCGETSNVTIELAQTIMAKNNSIETMAH